MGRVAKEVVDDAPAVGTRNRETPSAVEDPESGGIDAAAGKLRNQRSDFGQITRFPAVVGIEKGDVFAPRFGHGPVAGDADPGVGLHEEPHQRRTDGPHDFGTPVGRTVVHDDDLHGRQRLRQHGAERGAHLIALVEQRHNHRNRRTLHNRAFLAKIPIFCYFCK